MEGLNCKNEKSNLKMQRPNMALTKHGIRANGLSFLRDQTVEREEMKKREEEEEEEEKKKMKERSSSKAKKVWNYMEL